MHKEIETVITEIYGNRNKDFYVSCCYREMGFITGFLEDIKEMCQNVIISNLDGEPSVEIIFHLKDFVESNFEVKYSSILKISKLCRFYNMQHEFSVDNKDIDGLFPELDGLGDEAYTKQQFALEEVVCNYLQEKKYERLFYSDMSEVVPDIPMPPDSFFGKQMTVETALFRDVWNIAGDELLG